LKLLFGSSTTMAGTGADAVMRVFLQSDYVEV
jgi:hypothetical protein